jgi:very-short-patch-repair endonuclease
MTKIYNKKSEQSNRRELRFKQTLAEKTVWIYIRKKQIENIRFLRQYSVNKYILDFYAPEIKLGIEIDGDSHIGMEQYDKYRQDNIEKYRIKIIRFSNEQVLNSMEKVIKNIIKAVQERRAITN